MPCNSGFDNADFKFGQFEFIMILEMAQNGRRFAVNSRNLISNAIRLMKLSIIGFLMMTNSILTILHRSHDLKWFKMAAVLR